MKSYKKLYVAVFSICLLYLLMPLKTTRAEENVMQNRMQEEAGNTGFASSEQEFLRWLSANKTVGGHLYLTDDIVIRGTYDYVGGVMMRYLKPVTIHTSGYHIYVEGILSFDYCGYQLTVEGTGRKEGLIHVRTGGLLYLSMAHIRAADQGKAVVTEPGGAVVIPEEEGIAPRLEGGVDLDVRPFVIRDQQSYDYESIQPKEEAFHAALLPEKEMVTLVYGTQTVQRELFLEWDVEAVRESLEKKERCRVKGRYTGTVVLDGLGEIDASSCFSNEVPVCSVVFSNEGAAIRDSHVEIDQESGGLILHLFYRVPGPSAGIVCLVSEDAGENWEILMEQKRQISMKEWDMGGFSIPVGTYKEQLFSIAVRYVDGREIYTEVVGLSDMTLVSRGEIGGNRGGGTDLNGPAASGPDTAGPDNTSGEAGEEGPEPGEPDEGDEKPESGEPQSGEAKREPGRTDTGEGKEKPVGTYAREGKPEPVESYAGSEKPESGEPEAGSKKFGTDESDVLVLEDGPGAGQEISSNTAGNAEDLPYQLQIILGSLTFLIVVIVFICLFSRR